tara:strand:- start:152 stop:340 length:189 start_codon:yes stop_codon:yes gene_type:complete
MRYLATFCVLVMIGCSTLFNPAKYNPNPTPADCCPKDSVKVDTIRLTNGVDHIIMLDTVKVK